MHYKYVYASFRNINFNSRNDLIIINGRCIR
jgi:hypothetical protein